MLAKALSAHAGVGFMAVDIADVVKGGIGESEMLLAALFLRAKHAAPCGMVYLSLTQP
jgi:SpoVK/Ycf46/Vps4 family AAA+-type ATPase